ncbi:MAG: glycerophosphodiester phosphodiesterase [bacterium]|nr:glycerophosphodiester phosphodiesterase [bacterium]
MLKTLIANSWQNIYRNKYGFLIGGSLLHFFMTVAGVGLLSVMFRGILLVSGQPNLTKDNLGAFLSSPLSILAWIFYLIAVAFLTFVEFSFLITLIESRRTGSGFSFKKVFSQTLKNMKSLVLGGQIPFFLAYFVIMIPFGNLGLNSVLLNQIKIPDFIIGELFKSESGALMSVLLFAGVFYLNLRLIFTLPLSILSKKSLVSNIKKSWQITRRNKLKIILAIGFFNVILAFVALGIMAIVGITLEKFAQNLDFWLSKTIFYTTLDAVSFGFLMMSKITIVVVLLNYLNASTLIKETHKERKKRSKLLVITVLILFIGSIVSNAVKIYYARPNKNILNIAHRGDIYGGVENSLEALESAKSKGAHLVEMDIQLTRDGHFVVVHDTNLKRLTGQDLRVGDLTLEQIQALRISDGNFESRIPTFEEFVARAKSLKIGLLIEIKTHGQEPENLPQLFIKKVRDLGISKTERVMSIDLGLISKIERLAPEIKTGGVIPLIFGDFGRLNLDFYAVEDFSFRPKFIKRSKNKKLEIFVWTINDRERISRYIQSEVDGIITDRLDLAEQIQHEFSRDKFGDFVRFLEFRR